jgi:hypothetical protein
MNCPHQSQPSGKDTGRRICSLGLYGGIPFAGNCLACMARGENTTEFSTDLLARTERSHPATAPRVSGCCDSAKNYRVE